MAQYFQPSGSFHLPPKYFLKYLSVPNKYYLNYLNKNKVVHLRLQHPRKERRLQTLLVWFLSGCQSCHLWAQWRAMSPSSESVHYLARRTCTHDPCRIFKSAVLGQRFHWLKHVKSFPKTRTSLHLAAFAQRQRRTWQFAEMEPGRHIQVM